MAALTAARFEPSILVNNAGGWLPQPVLTTSERAFEAALRFNVTSAFLLSRLAVPHLAAHGEGAIVNISSRAASMVQPCFTAYGAAKAALSFMTRNMAPELAPKVRVNAIEVGGVETDALSHVSTAREFTVTNFHVAPLFASSVVTTQRGRHEWWLELRPDDRAPPFDAERFAADLDRDLAARNDDYAAKRGGHGLEVPLVRSGALVGVIGFESITGAVPWTTEDVTVLKAVATLFAQVTARRSAGHSLAVAEADLAHTVDALQHSEARFERLVDHLPLAVHRFDRKGRLLTANRLALEAPALRHGEGVGVVGKQLGVGRRALDLCAADHAAGGSEFAVDKEAHGDRHGSILQTPPDRLLGGSGWMSTRSCGVLRQIPPRRRARWRRGRVPASSRRPRPAADRDRRRPTDSRCRTPRLAPSPCSCPPILGRTRPPPGGRRTRGPLGPAH